MLPRIEGTEALNGENGFVATANENRQYGWELAAGDIDGDGYADLAVGVPYMRNPEAFGDFFLLWGGSHKFPATFNQKAYVADNCNGVRLLGPTTTRNFSFQLAIGKVDGGAAANLLVATKSKKLFVFRSGSRSIYTNFFYNQVDDFSAQHGSIITDLPFTYRLKLADLNNDGINEILIIHTLNSTIDVIVGRPEGFAPVISINDMTSTQKFRITGTLDAGFASNVAITDLNHDGVNDILVTAPKANNNTGEVYGFLMPKNGSFVDRHASSNDFLMTVGKNDVALNGLARSSIGAGDITGDGIDEIVVCGGDGSPYFTKYNIYCAVLIGKEEFRSFINASTLQSPDVFFAYLGDQQLKNPFCVGMNGGIGVVDINQDGYKDLYITNNCMEHNPAMSVVVQNQNNGSVAFIFGRNPTEKSFLPAYNRSHLIGNEGVDWKGKHYGSFGYQAVVADFDGDGRNDMAVSAPYQQDASSTEEVFVVMSSANKTAAMPTCEVPSPTYESPQFNPQETPISAATRETPDLFKAARKLMSKEVISAGVMGATNGAAEAVEYATQVRGWSQTKKYVALGAVYGLGVYGTYRVNYHYRYNEMNTSGMSEVDKVKLARTQAVADTAGMLVAHVAVAGCGKAFQWLGNTASNNGWTSTGEILNWIGQKTVSHLSYAYPVYQHGLVPAVVAAEVGSGAKDVVSTVGKVIVDVADAVAIPKDTYKASKMTLFSSQSIEPEQASQLRMVAGNP